jgi:NAD(P)-dependent dehydrogenase (short-subunit alcohol dehydrogenase family)
MNLENRVVVISGATGNLGRTAAGIFAEHGTRLVLIGTNTARLDQLSRELDLPGGRFMTCNANLGQAANATNLVAAVMEKFQQIDILLHLVGGWKGGIALVDVTEDETKEMLTQHLWTTFHLVQAVLPAMLARNWGRILVISSPSASDPPAHMAPYSIGKAAQEALMLTVAEEVKDSGITANMVLVKSIVPRQAHSSETSSRNAAGTTPEDICSVLLYLCSEEAGRINGARIPFFGKHCSRIF